MTELPQFNGIEDCLDFIWQHSAELVQMTVDVEEADVSYLNDGAARYACTAEEFLSAATMLHIQQEISAQSLP